MGLAVLAGALALMSLADASASAMPADTFVGSFGNKGTGGGQFKEPVGVAVNDSTEPGAPAAGDVYVVDRGNNRVERFSATGSYLGKFNGSGSFEAEGKVEQGVVAPTGPLSTPSQIAVDDSGKTPLQDPSVGDVYVMDAGHQAIDKFSPTGDYLGQFDAASVGAPFDEREVLGLTVDGFGNLWVYETGPNGDGSLYEFTAEGGFVESFKTGRGSNGGLAEPLLYGVAIDANGNLYVNCCSHDVLKLSPTGQGLAEFSPNNTTALALDDATNSLYVDKGTSVERYGVFGEPDASPQQTFGTGSDEALSESNGLAVNGVNSAVYVSDRAADKIDVFRPSSVSVEAASNVEKRVGGTAVATLNGTVNPEGTAVTACRFEYGQSTSYGQSVACAELPGAGTAAVAVAATLNGLQQDTVYNYRLVVANSEAQITSSENETFQTPLAVAGLETRAASDVTQTGAMLNGSLLQGDIGVTACRFEYGIGSSVENSTPCSQPLVPSAEPVEVAASVVGLKPNTAYRYRLVVTNEYGTTASADGRFYTTLMAATVTDSPAFASAVGQFTVTLNGTINPANDVTSYHFVYGPTSAYGSSAPVPEGFTPVNYQDDAVSEQLGGLQAGTTYHFALVVTNGAGTVTGPDETFTTASVPPPLASTGAASDVTRGEALLSGTINPQGWSTAYRFEYGTSTAYGSSWPTVDINLGSFADVQDVAVDLQNLVPGATYHYRLVATSPGGTTYGSDGTFTTGEYPVSVIQSAPLLTAPGFAFPPASPGAAVVVKHKQIKSRGRSKRKAHRKHVKQRGRKRVRNRQR